LLLFLIGRCGIEKDTNCLQRQDQSDFGPTGKPKAHCLYIAAYWAVLGLLDAIVFTADIGENSV
jgi:acetate kinase